MNSNFVDIRFEGAGFHPSELISKTKLPIRILAEHSVPATKGRYKGQLSPYGIGVLDITPATQRNINDLIDEYCDKLMESKHYLTESGVDEVIFDIESSREYPVNVILSNSTLRKLASINAKVELHSFEDEDEEKEEDEENAIVKALRTYDDNLYEKVIAELKKHPSINSADAIPYFIFFFSQQPYSGNIDKKLNEFEQFYGKLVKH